jgi:hypothetical protein
MDAAICLIILGLVILLLPLTMMTGCKHHNVIVLKAGTEIETPKSKHRQGMVLVVQHDTRFCPDCERILK